MVYHHKQSVNNSLGHNPPYLILRGGRVVDVQSGVIREGPVVVKKHRIVGLGDDVGAYLSRDAQVLELNGRFVLPGFIEPHIHVESSMLTLTNFSRVVLPRGTTTVINDPHEIANVLGVRGVRQMMDEGHYTNLRFYFTVPSCIPTLSEEFETSGAAYTLEDVKALLMEKDAIGLGEMMNYPGVVACDEHVLAKIYETYRVRGYKKLPPIIDGHAPGLGGVELSAYINAGIMADHECSSGEEMEERLRKGMFVMVRNGSSAKNAETLLAYAINHGIDPRRLMFCSDDRNPFDLLRHGHLDQTLALGARLARESGGRLRLIDVIRMATLTPAEFFHMAYRGRLGIGTRADIVVVDDLESFRVHATIRNGELVARDGQLVDDVEDYPYHNYMLQSVKIAHEFRADDFRIRSSAANPRVRVIRMIPGQLLTEQFVEPLSAPRGSVEPDVGGDVLKLAVIERHGKNGGRAIGFVRGFGIKHGAMATTIGHDSHNLGVIGTNDEDMAHAVRELARLQGGVVVARDGRTIAALPLRVGGLMSTEAPEKVVTDKMAVYEAYKQLGGTLKDPVVAMSFLQLPVIPALKMSDKGLVEMGPAGPRLVPLFAD